MKNSKEHGVLRLELGAETIWGRGAARLLGGLLILIGFSVLATYAGDLNSMLMVLFVALPFLALGLWFTLGRMGVIVDQNRGTLTTWRGLLVPMWRKVTQVSALTSIQISKKVVKMSGDARTVTTFPVRACNDAGLAILLSESKDYGTSRRSATRLARFLSIGLVDEVEGGGLKDPFLCPNNLRIQLRTQGARDHGRGASGSSTDKKSRPVEKRAAIGVVPKIERTATVITYEIPAMGFRFRHAFNAFIGALAVCVALSLCACFFPPLFFALIVAFPLLAVVLFLGYREEMFGSQKIVITRDDITIEARKQSLRLRMDDLQELNILAIDTTEGRRWTTYGGGILEVATPTEMIRFGDALSRDDLEKLHDDICEMVLAEEPLDPQMAESTPW